MARFTIPQADGQRINKGVTNVRDGSDTFGKQITDTLAPVMPTAEAFGKSAAMEQMRTGQTIANAGIAAGKQIERVQKAKENRRKILNDSEEAAQRKAVRSKYSLDVKKLKKDLVLRAKEQNWTSTEYEENFTQSSDDLKEQYGSDMSEHSLNILQSQLDEDSSKETETFLDNDLTDHSLYSRRRFITQQDNMYVEQMGEGDYNQAKEMLGEIILSRTTEESVVLNSAEDRSAQAQVLTDTGWLANIKNEAKTNPDRVFVRLNNPDMYTGMSVTARKEARDHLAIVFQLDEEKQTKMRKERQAETTANLIRQIYLKQDVNKEIDTALEKKLISVGEYSKLKKMTTNVQQDGTISEEADVVFDLDVKAISGNLKISEIDKNFNAGLIKRSTATRLLGINQKARKNGATRFFNNPRVKMELERLKGAFAVGGIASGIENQKREQSFRVYDFKEKTFIKGENPQLVVDEILSTYNKGYKKSDLPKLKYTTEKDLIRSFKNKEITKKEFLIEKKRLEEYRKYDVSPISNSVYKGK